MLAEQKNTASPEFVADEIARLIESANTAGDIAILLRSTESRAVRACTARPRHWSVGGAADFFERPEVSAMMYIVQCKQPVARSTGKRCAARFSL